MVADRGAAVIYALENVTMLEEGTVPPDRTIDSPDLRSPDRLFLAEP